MFGLKHRQRPESDESRLPLDVLLAPYGMFTVLPVRGPGGERRAPQPAPDALEGDAVLVSRVEQIA